MKSKNNVIVLTTVAIMALMGCQQQQETQFFNAGTQQKESLSSTLETVLPPTTLQKNDSQESVTMEVSKNTLPSNIYPNRNAKVGEKYGAMTFEKINSDTDTFGSIQMGGSSYAHFKGSVTLTGSYVHYGDEEPFGLGDQVCFYLDSKTEIQKLPQSQYMYDAFGQEPSKSFCFNNNDLAEKLLGTEKGTATIVISALDDNIDMEGEASNYATLVKVISKTVNKK